MTIDECQPGKLDVARLDAEAIGYDSQVIARQAALIARLRRSQRNLACAACAGWTIAVGLLALRGVAWWLGG